MRRVAKIPLAILVILLAGLACNSQSAPTETQTPLTVLSPTLLDCVADLPDCPQIEFIGETPTVLPDGTESPFRGYADPTVRSDPETGVLWMAYSAPNLYAINSNRPVPKCRNSSGIQQRQRQNMGISRCVVGCVADE